MIAVVLVVLCTCAMGWAKQPKYVFFFIGDGMGMNQVAGAQYFLGAAQNGKGTVPLGFTQFPYTGMATTWSASSDVTDSAAGGTALATGHKTNNGVIGLDASLTRVPSIAEMAKARGLRVGVATSVTVNHATPASFYGHRESRNMYYELGTDLVASGFDFFAGGDFAEKVNPDDREAPHLYDLAAEAGYTIVRGYDDYVARHAEADKMILIQREGALENTLPYAIDATGEDLTLAQITTAAIDFLYRKKDRKGFFLMVEGGKIDYACHSNDAATAFHEVIDFDRAISVAYEFYLAHPDETLIVISADHETGGLTLGTGSYALDYRKLQAQKVSHAGFSRVINRLRHENRDEVSWEQVKAALQEYFGFWATVEPGQRAEQALQKEYERSFTGDKKVKMAESLYYRDEPISALAVQVLNRTAMVAWPHGSHTAAYVPIFAVGAGAERFCGQMDNTEIPLRIAEVAGYRR